MDSAALQREAIADWLDDRSRLLHTIDPDAALELGIVAGAVRAEAMLPGGIIRCEGQPFPTNGGRTIG